MDLIDPREWTDTIAGDVYGLLLSDTNRILDEEDRFATMSLRSSVSDLECVGDIAIDPGQMAGSGSFLSVRRYLRVERSAQYDVLKWFPDVLGAMTWHRLLRSADDYGNDVPGDGWVTEYALRARSVAPTNDDLYALRYSLRELRESGVQLQLPPLS